MSDHTYVIVSTETNSRLHTIIRYYSHYELELKPFTIEQRRSYIEMFFQRFNKVSLRKRKFKYFVRKILNSNPDYSIFNMNSKIAWFKFWFLYYIN